MWAVHLEPRALAWLEEECCAQTRDRAKVRAGFDRIFALLAEVGPALDKPHAEYLGDGMREARYRWRRVMYRMFYVEHDGAFLVAGGMVKKRPRLTPDQRATARRWCAEAVVAHKGGVE